MANNCKEAKRIINILENDPKEAIKPSMMITLYSAGESTVTKGIAEDWDISKETASKIYTAFKVQLDNKLPGLTEFNTKIEKVYDILKEEG